MNIETKFKLGDDSYFLEDNHIVKGTIEKIEITVDKDSYHEPEILIYYSVSKRNATKNMHESDLFETVEELLKHLENSFYAKGS